ncbi:MAG: hypothetical protein AVDCRST_MAG93-2020 [uncultured Chloroflexia bacterium]|uniref:Uncharacterized protein n=1 Tax=uncultured Chloroflexia bacterium TaxID=1672391 RepID=A0A6J4IQW6_9CHLR|nr:MAG: hypothetical protein AVDCRST_MAG93-2020 [uncultured Chloroflexia bacterium]
MSAAKRARVKAKDEAEFRRWEKLAEKLRRQRHGPTPKDDESSLRLSDNA